MAVLKEQTGTSPEWFYLLTQDEDRSIWVAGWWKEPGILGSGGNPQQAISELLNGLSNGNKWPDIVPNLTDFVDVTK